MKILNIKNENGIPFNVIIKTTVPCKNCDKVIIVYDDRYKNKRDRFDELMFGEFGQPISSYYIFTILDIKETGINMQSGIPDWVLSAENVKDIQKFILEN